MYALKCFAANLGVEERRMRSMIGSIRDVFLAVGEGCTLQGHTSLVREWDQAFHGTQ